MGWIIGSGLRFGRLIVALAIGLLVIGIAQLRAAPVDVYPEFLPTSVEVQTEALGLSAAEVEQLITVPLEQDLLNGVPWLDKIHSASMPGLSAIDLTFQPGTNVYSARQMVQERMTQAHALPNVGSPPIMVQPLASVSRVAMIRLSSKQVSLIDMSVLARWHIKLRLMGAVSLQRFRTAYDCTVQPNVQLHSAGRLIAYAPTGIYRGVCNSAEERF